MILIESKLKFKYLILALLSTALIFLSHWIMYGFLGVLLPMACLIALKMKNRFWAILPMFIAALCNAQYLLNAIKLMPLLFYSIITCAALAILFAFILIKLKINWKVLAVGHFLSCLYGSEPTILSSLLATIFLSCLYGSELFSYSQLS